MKEILRNPDSFAKILDLTISALSVEDIMTGVVAELRELFNCARCTLYVVDGPAKELYTQVLQSDRIGNFRIPLDKASIAGFIAVTGKALLIDDVADPKKLGKIDPELRFNAVVGANDPSATKQMMAVPLTMRGATIGVLQAMNKPGGFLERDFAAMKEFAPILALALSHALLTRQD